MSFDGSLTDIPNYPKKTAYSPKNTNKSSPATIAIPHVSGQRPQPMARGRPKLQRTRPRSSG
jgi:hypothetical protein